ncbi:hypothetical protein [Lacipirellula limnantheis]|uniref:Uncharacterized protein n=1 Tax=Lacipirellula limnantheis TaxID=2528024 RepID=A0A517U534_9BACT|nr:hypothetical protein [Lacipirellula limnantheis]QDT75751.1 hypothetical protein I41_49930 [Lacipirellula limnantheis]
MSGSGQKAPVGYVGADPKQPMSIALRQQMRGDVCAQCAARVLVHSVGFRAHKKQHAARGIGIKLLCPKCAEQARSELPPGPTIIALPPKTDLESN